MSDFELLRQLHGSLVIPPAVAAEVIGKGSGYPVQDAVRTALGKWISVADAPDPVQVNTLHHEFRLDLGESQAILVAEQLGHVPLLMDEQRGVRVARMRGFRVIRTPLIYADAKTLGLIGSIREKLNELRAKGFRLSDRHYWQILDEVGEI